MHLKMWVVAPIKITDFPINPKNSKKSPKWPKLPPNPCLGLMLFTPTTSVLHFSLPQWFSSNGILCTLSSSFSELYIFYQQMTLLGQFHFLQNSPPTDTFLCWRFCCQQMASWQLCLSSFIFVKTQSDQSPTDNSNPNSNWWLTVGLDPIIALHHPPTPPPGTHKSILYVHELNLIKLEDVCK